ncbi:MAG: hypothetical protein GEU90_15485 [Gemmatimonas sp.]|nr:hypothetical protein [Gemmatimonas sp.]
MSSPLVFFQMMTSQPEDLRSFLEGVFDWTFAGTVSPESGGSIDPQGPADIDVKGAILRADSESPAVVPYFRVPDLWETVKRAESLGAVIITPIFQTAGGAHTATLRTPDGLHVGLFQA